MTLRQKFFQIRSAWLIVGVMLMLGLAVQPAQAVLGWVGNMYPGGGAVTAKVVGDNLTVYVQVYKAGVTDQAGQGANITCSLVWANVPYFASGVTWSNQVTTPMVYNTDIGNNDEYMATITPGVGLYAYSVYCTDTSDGQSTWQAGTDAYLVVDTPSGSCNSAVQGDHNVYFDGLAHNSFLSPYRDPFGAVKTNQNTVNLKFRTCMDDLNAYPRIRVYNDRTNTETWTELTLDYHASDPALGGVTYWSVAVPIPTQATVLYYIFEGRDGTATVYYRDDDPKFYGGGWGSPESDASIAQQNSYQLTVYDENFSTPTWLQDAVIYQIFPERFRNGDPGNDPIHGTDWIYGQTVRKLAWTDDLCDPRSTCPNEWSNQFFGGDLQGIIDELDYLSELGITALYLNPIFEAPSNHLYDTQNYLEIDPYFGDLTAFQILASEAEARGIKLILDGVFNHVSSDSSYFDRYSRWDASGALTSPSAPGSNDQSGACESTASAWRGWFTFIPDPSNKCYDGTPGSQTMTYADWAGYDSLAKLDSSQAAVQSYIYSGGSGAVGRYWLAQGADGWRFDVGGDVEHGTATGDAYGYWSGFRSAAHSQFAQTALLGEEWGDASAWLVGDQWDSVMNYRFRSALLSWMFDSCTGNGCDSGVVFSDNDSNSGSSSGSISAINEVQLDDRLNSIREDYPAESWYAMMNLMGSHDTNRVLFLLNKISGDDAGAALAKFKFLSLLQFTYPGAPTLYYGDEAGLAAAGVWDTTWSKWEDDPYNRAPYPWADEGRSPDEQLQEHFRRLAVLRGQYAVLRTGDLDTLLADNSQRVYAYARTSGTSDLAVVALNRDNSSARTVSLTGLDPAFDGTTLYDVMNCSGTPVSCPSYTVSAGGLSNIQIPALWGALLVEGPLPAYNVTLTAASAQLDVNDSTQLTASVTNLAGEPAADGTQVDFVLVDGLGSLSAASALVSGGAGQASLTYTAPNQSTVAVIQASSGSYRAAQAAAAVFVGYNGTVIQITSRLTGVGPESVSLSNVVQAEKLGLGEPVVTLTQFDQIPNAGGNMSSYFDVHLSSAAQVDSLTLTVDYTVQDNEADHMLYWWNGSGWVQVFDPTGVVVDTAADRLTFTITATTSPSLSQLTGTMFVVGNGNQAPTAISLAAFELRSAANPWIWWLGGLGISTLVSTIIARKIRQKNNP